MSEEEVYTFSVVLCDNDIDRDFERFDEQALHTLKELFVGKTGVFDHDPKAENQTARIYDCTVERITARKTRTGEDYLRLIAKAYLPRSKRNEDFILALDSGIQKEVSVGCAVSGNICSICGEDRKKNACRHQKGKTYGGKLCHDVLTGVTDAYEWSFVAVPAQRLGWRYQVLEDARRTGEGAEGNYKGIVFWGGYLLECAGSEKAIQLSPVA